MNDDDALTLEAYLDEWLALQRTRIEPTTWTNYQLMVRCYLRAAWGSAALPSSLAATSTATTSTCSTTVEAAAGPVAAQVAPPDGIVQDDG